jgi:hypothetical protein
MNFLARLIARGRLEIVSQILIPFRQPQQILVFPTVFAHQLDQLFSILLEYGFFPDPIVRSGRSIATSTSREFSLPLLDACEALRVILDEKSYSN